MTVDLIKFTDEMREYLTEKFPDAPKAAIHEAANCIGFKVAIFVNTAVGERDEWWRNEIHRSYDGTKSRIKSRNSQNSVSQGEFDSTYRGDE